MEFRLLGPVEMVIDGQPVALAASRQEIVLVMLLLQANRVVSVDRLVDALWADNPPRTAKTQVMIIISALRRLLGKEIVVTQPPGYSIHVPDEAVDLFHFSNLAGSGGRASEDRDLGEAARLLRSALALWRGPAMEGVSSDVVRAATTQLNERRIAVWQDCLDLELQLGKHVSLIGELAGLIVRYPLNERFRGQLMLALYRSGRQADALATFRAGRDILRTELGLDPGEELRRLEEDILTRNPRIDFPGRHQAVVPSTARDLTAPHLTAPHQLPRTIADFVGREQILAQMSRVLSGADGPDAPDVPVIVLTGRGGVGKTALAVRAAHLLSTVFPDGQLFIGPDAGARSSTAGMLEYLLRSAGVHPDAIPGDLDSRSALLRSWLADRKVLMVIDGADHAGQVLPLLPGTRGCAVIVTGGQRLASLEGARTIDVGPLETHAAYRLLAALLGAGRVNAEEQAARELIELCDGLPLALRIVAAKLASRPHWRIDRMVRQLLDEERRLDELDLDGASVRATLAAAYDSLEADAKRLLRRLSLAGTDGFPPWMCAPLTDLDADHADDLLHALVEAHLVEARFTEDGMVRYRLRDLVRIYAMEHLAREEPAASRLDSVRRMLGCWLFLATMAHRRIYGGDFAVLHGTAEHFPLSSGIVDGLLENPAEWFRAERPGLMAAIGKASELGLDELCWDLAVTSAAFFEVGSYREDWRVSHASALSTARAAGNRRGEAALLYSLGTQELGTDLVTARDYFTRSLGTFGEIADDYGRALALAGVAFVDCLEGSYDRALPSYQEAVAGFRAAGDLVGEGHVLKNMAQIHMDRLDFEVAKHLLDSALAICEKLGSVRLTAQVLHELAELHLRRGRLAHAADVLAIGA